MVYLSLLSRIDSPEETVVVLKTVVHLLVIGGASRNDSLGVLILFEELDITLFHTRVNRDNDWFRYSVGFDSYRSELCCTVVLIVQ